MQEIRVYTTSYCGYCKQAKALLDQLKLPFKEIGLDGQDELRMRLSQENRGWRTVPMIFIGQTFVGGFQELLALKVSGKLMEMVQGA
jgi:glutaredoxin 3